MKKTLVILSTIILMTHGVLYGQTPVTSADTVMALGKDDPNSDSMEEWAGKLNTDIKRSITNKDSITALKARLDDTVRITTTYGVTYGDTGMSGQYLTPLEIDSINQVLLDSIVSLQDQIDNISTSSESSSSSYAQTLYGKVGTTPNASGDSITHAALDTMDILFAVINDTAYNNSSGRYTHADSVWTFTPTLANDDVFFAALMRTVTPLTLQDTTQTSPTSDNTITCTSSGDIYIASTVYEGYWEYDFRRPTGTTDLKVLFLSEELSSTHTNVRLEATNQEAILLKEYTSFSQTTYFTTATSYVAVNTWYRMRVERNSSIDEFFTGAVGDFRVLIKGGSFGTASWTVVNAPVAELAHNTSAYFILSIDTDDQVRNININGTTIDVTDFVANTGSYSTSINNDQL